jgi:DNA-binding MarR family transcriptional regulator
VKDLYHQSLDYIRETMGQAEAVAICDEASTLPVYLNDRYRFYVANLLGRECLVAVSRDGDGEAPAAVSKQLSQVRDRLGKEVVYVVQNMTPYNRKRLIEQRLPFVVPRRQIYLPGFGIDLREQFGSRKRQDTEVMNAISQLFVIRQIYRRDIATKKLSEWAAELGYSAMTITRTADELADLQLVEVHREARSKFVGFLQEGRSLWDAARDRMSSPVKKAIWVEEAGHNDLHQTRAGQSALADYTMISEPSYRTLAIFDRTWSMVQKSFDLHESNFGEEGLRIELWRYDPSLVREGNDVDELSLWLSLQGDDDERVSMARDDLLERVPW